MFILSSVTTRRVMSENGGKYFAPFSLIWSPIILPCTQVQHYIFFLHNVWNKIMTGNRVLHISLCIIWHFFKITHFVCVVLFVFSLNCVYICMCIEFYIHLCLYVFVRIYELWVFFFFLRYFYFKDIPLSVYIFTKVQTYT